MNRETVKTFNYHLVNINKYCFLYYSYITTTFMVESLSIANAFLRLQKKENSSEVIYDSNMIKIALKCNELVIVILRRYAFVKQKHVVDSFASYWVRAVVLNRWATVRKSGEPRTSACFENGFACRIRLRNTGPCDQSYGPLPVKWRGNDLFFGDQFHSHVILCLSQ